MFAYFTKTTTLFNCIQDKAIIFTVSIKFCNQSNLAILKIQLDWFLRKMISFVDLIELLECVLSSLLRPASWPFVDIFYFSKFSKFNVKWKSCTPFFFRLEH